MTRATRHFQSELKDARKTVHEQQMDNNESNDDFLIDDEDLF